MISYFHIQWTNIPSWVWFALGPPLTLFAAIVPSITKAGTSQLCVIAYFCLLLTAYFFAVTRASVLPVTHPSYLMCALGYFLFALSDALLIAREFGVMEEKRRCEVMLSYGIGQTLIVLGCGLSKVDAISVQ
jgi:hypothetical protein